MSKKTGKVINIVVNILVVIVLVLVAFITLNIIFSRDKQYTPLFGHTFVAVETDSMNGAKPEDVSEDKPSGFKEGDLIKIRLLGDEDKKTLEKGDVITFYQIINGERKLNTHRITEVTEHSDGSLYFDTKGDNNIVSDELSTSEANVIGIYTGSKTEGLGSVVTFFYTSTGFFICLVIPSFLIVAYFAVNLALTVKKSKKSADIEDKEND